MEAIRRDGVTALRRSSGGGAVFHDDGNLNFTLLRLKGCMTSEKQLSVVLQALEASACARVFRRNDTAGRTQVLRKCVFHSHGISMRHGTLLIKTDMTRLAKYLSPSS